MDTWWYAAFISRTQYRDDPDSASCVSSIRGIGYAGSRVNANCHPTPQVLHLVQADQAAPSQSLLNEEVCDAGLSYRGMITRDDAVSHKSRVTNVTVKHTAVLLQYCEQLLPLRIREVRTRQAHHRLPDWIGQSAGEAQSSAPRGSPPAPPPRDVSAT